MINTSQRLVSRCGRTFTLVYRNHEDHNLLVNNLINQPIAATAQFDFVAVRQCMQTIGFNTRSNQNRSQLFLELLTHGIS
ncbi:hypothetical protein AAY86_26120 [Pseudomonas amygdali pv. tabaci str. ATCC 11528]|nr:hypothetical protein C1E_0210575 [Pseudomonas amygdali pv. tabaci str. ATCC 11528]KKY49791.1 hypothetical protein AAY86_26120 [Pseudomonas amygdali pv. tabaci str. ATCC 11528]KKY57790.1 hypothetical protein AAY85_11450 [Pseudomonas amygdali pv. lachrymans]